VRFFTQDMHRGVATIRSNHDLAIVPLISWKLKLDLVSMSFTLILFLLFCYFLLWGHCYC